MSDLPPGVVGLSERGFEDYASFRDSYGSEITIRESSAASGPHCWIFAGDNPHMENPRPHLTPDQAKLVIQGLQAFIDRVPERWAEPQEGESDAE